MQMRGRPPGKGGRWGAETVPQASAVYTRENPAPQITLPGPEALPLAIQPYVFLSCKEQGTLI